MSNLVNFDANFKLVNLKRGFSLDGELGKIPTKQWKNTNSILANQWVYEAFQKDGKFIEMVVSTVKEMHFIAHQSNCSISLNSLVQPPLTSCKSPQTNHLIVVAQALYRSYGIEVKQVDDLENPHTMVVTWHRDNQWLNPPTPYLVQSRKEGFRTDCTLKFGEKLYPVHGAVLAAKSSYFEKMFKSDGDEAKFGAIIPISMRAVEEKSVEMVLDYFYTGELDLKEASITRIDDLLNFSSHFELPHLEQLCFEHLCKSVNAGNLKKYIAFARHYKNKELELALAQHVAREVTIENFAELIRLGKSEKIENLDTYCMAGIKQQIKRIDYEECGFGRSTQLQTFVKFFDAAIETQSSFMLPLLINQIRKVHSHPGYGTHLEKLIQYLSVVCQYETKFNWLPESMQKDLSALKNELYNDVLRSITDRGTDMYKTHFKRDLFEECKQVAKQHKLEKLETASREILAKK